MRPAEELVACIQQAKVETLVDVRRFPGSRRNPQFGQAALPETLCEGGIAYRHAEELLVARGHQVTHLIRPGRQEPHRLYDESEVRDGRLYLCGAEVA